MFILRNRADEVAKLFSAIGRQPTEGRVEGLVRCVTTRRLITSLSLCVMLKLCSGMLRSRGSSFIISDQI